MVYAMIREKGGKIKVNEYYEYSMYFFIIILKLILDINYLL